MSENKLLNFFLRKPSKKEDSSHNKEEPPLKEIKIFEGKSPYKEHLTKEPSIIISKTGEITKQLRELIKQKEKPIEKLHIEEPSYSPYEIKRPKTISSLILQDFYKEGYELSYSKEFNIYEELKKVKEELDKIKLQETDFLNKNLCSLLDEVKHIMEEEEILLLEDYIFILYNIAKKYSLFDSESDFKEVNLEVSLLDTIYIRKILDIKEVSGINKTYITLKGFLNRDKTKQEEKRNNNKNYCNFYSSLKDFKFYHEAKEDLEQYLYCFYDVFHFLVYRLGFKAIFFDEYKILVQVFLNYNKRFIHSVESDKKGKIINRIVNELMPEFNIYNDKSEKIGNYSAPQIKSLI